MIEFKTTDEYIAEFKDEPEIQAVLQKVRQTIREITSDSTEKISYGMPTFFIRPAPGQSVPWLNKTIVHFAATKKHLGFYPTPSGVEAFADRLTEYKTSKGAIQFPWNKPIPYELIAEITQFRVDSVEG
jgi:uncharacterized protein YdhG (YjbR/CyaY superfamily)